MLKHSLISAAALLSPLLVASAQTTDASPTDVVYALFDAMRAGDGTAARDLIHQPDSSALNRMQADGTLRTGAFERWTNWLDEQEQGDADEQIFAVEAQEFGTLATVWAPFTLHYKDELVGCGVNMFTLGRIDDRWKIIAGIDTQADTPCETFESDYLADNDLDKVLYE